MNPKNNYAAIKKQDFKNLSIGDIVYYMSSEDLLVEFKIEKLEYPFIYNADGESWTYSSLMKKIQ